MKGAREVQLQRCRNDVGNHCPYTAPFMQPPTFLMWTYCWRAFLPPYYIGSHGMNDTHCPAIICTENCFKTSNINCFSSHPRQHTRCSAYLSRAVAALPASMPRVLCSSASIFSCTAHRWHPEGRQLWCALTDRILMQTCRAAMLFIADAAEQACTCPPPAAAAPAWHLRGAAPPAPRPGSARPRRRGPAGHARRRGSMPW